jgi:Na+-transporting NADH:ubiquinone oxidoreductase subunit NqrC
MKVHLINKIIAPCCGSCLWSRLHGIVGLWFKADQGEMLSKTLSQEQGDVKCLISVTTAM